MRKEILLAGLIVLAAIDAPAADRGRVTQSRAVSESGGNNWLLNGGSFRGEHFSALDQIDTRTAGDLGLAWSTDLPVADGISATPVVVDGVIYISGPFSLVFAIDAATGAILWSYDPEVRRGFADDPYLSWAARSNRGVAVWEGRVMVAVADCRLIALDASSGKPQWSKKTCDPELGYAITDAPRVGGGKVFIGNAGSESGEQNRGYVSAYDAQNGNLLWRFYTVPSPNPDENDSPAMKLAASTWTGDRWQAFGGGGSAWNEMTYDPDSGYLFFGTAGALPYVHRYRSPEGGDNLFLSSVLAVDAETGEYVWHYQTVPEDSWEYNATMNIVLADLEIKGRQRRALMIAPKNGFFYVLDRLSGELISAEKYVKANWASRINVETGRPVTDPDGQFWNTAAGTTTMLWPNMWGSHSWNPMAFHPVLRLAYIPAIDVPSIVTNLGGGDYVDTMDLIDEVDGKGHSPGKLVAWDPVLQRERWSVDHALPFNGGVLATAGNVVFQGDATGDFSAYDAANGKRIWSVATGSAINAAPVSYALDDTQYVLLPIGAGGGAQFLYPELHAGENARGPTRLLAFTLKGDLDMPRVPPDDRILPDLGFTASVETIERGKTLYSEHCSFCHGKNASARAGGSVPDLRFASEGTHAVWNGIVIGGARRANGMPAFTLSAQDAETIRQYVLFRADELRIRQ
ncbi:MAG: PQQ-dependent dehydrogenase, methanol/ethanol family [Woeseia sp.]